jgi:hypothetical protein
MSFTNFDRRWPLGAEGRSSEDVAKMKADRVAKFTQRKDSAMTEYAVGTLPADKQARIMSRRPLGKSGRNFNRNFNCTVTVFDVTIVAFVPQNALEKC